jgi:hypothetical protein
VLAAERKYVKGFPFLRFPTPFDIQAGKTAVSFLCTCSIKRPVNSCGFSEHLFE